VDPFLSMSSHILLGGKGVRGFWTVDFGAAHGLGVSTLPGQQQLKEMASMPAEPMVLRYVRIRPTILVAREVAAERF
jgi:hypothetical protein